MQTQSPRGSANRTVVAALLLLVLTAPAITASREPDPFGSLGRARITPINNRITSSSEQG